MQSIDDREERIRSALRYVYLDLKAFSIMYIFISNEAIYTKYVLLDVISRINVEFILTVDECLERFSSQMEDCEEKISLDLSR